VDKRKEDKSKRGEENIWIGGEEDRKTRGREV